MLRVANHRNRNIAHEDGTLDRRLLVGMQLDEPRAQRIGHAPAIYNGVYFKSAALDFGGIGLYLRFGLRIAGAVHHYGESACGRRGEERLRGEKQTKQ